MHTSSISRTNEPPVFAVLEIDNSASGGSTWRTRDITETGYAQSAHYAKKENKVVQCSLCNHRCTIAEGNRDLRGGKQNEGGTLYASTYGLVSAEAVDAIEKKPLFHYLPCTLSYLLGGVGSTLVRALPELAYLAGEPE